MSVAERVDFGAVAIALAARAADACVVAAGPVVYLAGEGHAGIARRLLAWSIQRRVALAAAPLFVSTTDWR